MKVIVRNYFGQNVENGKGGCRAKYMVEEYDFKEDEVKLTTYFSKTPSVYEVETIDYYDAEQAIEEARECGFCTIIER